jgi:Zn-finger nucleic acid-binding protein
MPITTCPRCKGSCTTVAYERVQIDECQSCKGIWLDPGELQEIIAREETRFTPEFEKETLKSARAGIPEHETTAGIACPFCNRTLRAINYNYASGVIINTCANHGIWLDQHELQRIEVFMEHWNREKSKHASTWINRSNPAGSDQDERTRKINASADQSPEEASLIFRIFDFLKGRN